MSSMDTTVLLVRHGQTLSNIAGRYMGWSDEGLSEEGMWQAKQLSRRLASWSIAFAYSSPLKRAYQTAGIIAAPHSLSVSPLEGLGEIRIGDWEGKSGAEIEVKFPHIWQVWRRDPSAVQMPGGENMAQVRERAIASFENILETNQGRQVLVVTHEVIVKLLVAHCLNVSTSIYRQFEVANASLTIIQLIDGRQRLRLLNDTGHLEANPR
ncbi:MAG TPA: histidine phosphatase family protein [Dehalococcoidia bacterium]|nr:histidine phosphatase family protein [Dehalococcoidia bacterium]